MRVTMLINVVFQDVFPLRQSVVAIRMHFRHMDTDVQVVRTAASLITPRIAATVQIQGAGTLLVKFVATSVSLPNQVILLVSKWHTYINTSNDVNEFLVLSSFFNLSRLASSCSCKPSTCM